MNTARLLAIWLCLLLGSGATAENVAPSSARFADPTDRYPHNVLGDLPGYGALEVQIGTGASLRLALPETRVFEDIAPRLWDVDGDGVAEIVVVESDQQLGARLTAWTVQQSADGAFSLALLAAGDFIGTRFRWLAPVGIADFTGNGKPEIAYVEMPHLAKRLVIVQLEGHRFVPIAQLDGISNHRIGDEFIIGGVRDCNSGPEIIVPNGDWRHVVRVIYADNLLTVDPTFQSVSVKAIDTILSC